MLFVANYKMNGDKNFYKKVNEIFNNNEFEDTIILCPPFVYMPFLEIQNKSVFLGSQDISLGVSKKSTGQISPIMLEEFGVRYALVGHSERREIGETDEIVAQKVKNAVENNIVPIICVGEKTKTAQLDVVEKQVKTALSLVSNCEVIIAYEPVWAIGSGVVPTVAKINEAIRIVRETAKKCGFEVPIIYGGSVNAGNYKEFKTSDADGFLTGTISVKLEEFIQVVKGE